MESVLLPPSIYKSALVTLLYVAQKNGCLFEFLSHNKIDHIATFLNEESEKQSLLCLAAMSANNSEVLTLISMGANPMILSQIVIDGDEIGEYYDMKCDTHYICDLAIIAKYCTFETFTKVVDSLLLRVTNKLNFNKLAKDLITVHLDHLDQYLRYLFSGLQKKNLLHGFLNSTNRSFIKKVYDKYKKDPILFEILFEYGLSSTTEIDYYFTVGDLMERDGVIRQLYETYSMTITKKAK